MFHKRQGKRLEREKTPARAEHIINNHHLLSVKSHIMSWYHSWHNKNNNNNNYSHTELEEKTLSIHIQSDNTQLLFLFFSF